MDMSHLPKCGRLKPLSASKMDPQREADIPRARQIILDDLRNAERTLAEVVAAGLDPERASHLRAVRAAIAKLETLVWHGSRRTDARRRRDR
jgi:hypothetical protein